MFRKRGLVVLLSLLVGLLPAALQGQFAQRSSISGFVTDSSKAAIVGATVTLRDLDRNQTQTTTTDSSGQYTFSDLTIGHYVVHAEQTGFRPLESQAVDLTTQQGKRLDLVLTPGTAVETVNVTSAVPLLETDHATVDQDVDQQQFQQLPINGRNFTSLTVLAPAISTYPHPTSPSSRGEWPMVFNLCRNTLSARRSLTRRPFPATAGIIIHISGAANRQLLTGTAS